MVAVVVNIIASALAAGLAGSGVSRSLFWLCRLDSDDARRTFFAGRRGLAYHWIVTFSWIYAVFLVLRLTDEPLLGSATPFTDFWRAMLGALALGFLEWRTDSRRTTPAAP